MQHINCTAPEAQEVINNTLIAPCIRGPHTGGPTLEEGASPEEVQQRATSRESLETYSHILIDMADIMQELVRYMNQYARLLHRDPPLEGGDLTHCQNLVDRMGAMFHEVSHAFHLLSDYGITLNTALPRRLWMAQLTGAHVVLSSREDGVGVPQQLRQELARLRNQVGQMSGAPGGVSTTSTASSSSTTSSSTSTSTSATTNTANTGTSTSTTATGSSTNPRPTATATGGNNGQPISISFDIPLGGNFMQPGMNPHAQIQQLLQNRANDPSGNNQPMPRPSLGCSSRHRYNNPTQYRCPVHQPQAGATQAPGGPTRSGHRHSHSHGPRHGHSHSHLPRPHSHGPPRSTPRSQPNSTANAPANAPDATMSEPQVRPPGPPTRPVPANPLPPNPLSLLTSMAGGGESPEQMARYMNLAMQMAAGSRQNEPMSTHWPEIRALMMPNVTIPDQSSLGDLLRIVASNFSFQEFINALNNNMMFDILYRPLRDHFTRSLFNNEAPDQMHMNIAVAEMLAADRSLILAFFDVRQESSQVDERSTFLSMVRELVNTIFRALYSPSRGDVAAGFGSIFGRNFLRFLGLIIAYCRHVNLEDPRNRLVNQMSGFLQSMVPFQTISRDELFDNYVVTRGSDDTEDEEFVDAEDDTKMEDDTPPAPESMDLEEASSSSAEKESPPPKKPSPNNDDLPDEIVVRTPAPAPAPAPAPVPAPVAVPTRAPTGAVSNGHSNRAEATEIPGEWKRVIENDSAKLENMTFQPLSDGYLTSLPAKRRKTEQNSTAASNPDELLKDLLSSSVPKSENGEVDLSQDPELGEMFRAKLKEDIKKKVKDNDDVNEEQFPCTSNLRNS